MSKPTRLKSTRKITSTTKNSQYESKSSYQTCKIKTNEQTRHSDLRGTADSQIQTKRESQLDRLANK